MKKTLTTLFFILLLTLIIPTHTIPPTKADNTNRIIPMIIIGTIENKTYYNGVMSFNAITIYRFTPLTTPEFRGFYQGTMRLKGLIGLATNHFICGYCQYQPEGW
ncbi:MAG: hypothetical protein V1726_02030 [Methanobacteriota archaeon]